MPTTLAMTESVRRSVGSSCTHVEDAGPGDAVDGVAPGLVARPADTDEVASVLRAAAAHGLRVVPRGRGTKLAWGLAPRGADVLLDLSALDQVVEHAAGDLIAVVQAGASMAEVQRVVAEGGQRLGLDDTTGGASVGGTLATNASGPLRMLTGTARDLVIGMTVVRADGVVAMSGGRVVKNVAGYDLAKLMIGSYGTLAVITQAIFRLHPVPPARCWVSVEVDGPTEAARRAGAVVHSQCVPAAVEVERPVDGPSQVHVLLEGRPDGVRGRAETVADLLGEDARTSDDPPPGWARVPWDVEAGGPDRGTALKLTCALSGLGDVLAAVGEGEEPVALRGSAGVGVLYASLAPGASPDAAARVVTRLRAVCERHRGGLVVLDGPPEVKAAVDVWGPVAAIELMRRVKDQFDPDHRLAPGRYVGGI